ncbi:MAG TPA: DNA polymerase, partial [Candidatus Paceibacterota bacterium]
ADDVETRPLDPNDLEGEWWMDICGYSAVRYEAIVLGRDEIHEAMGEIHADPEITVFEQNGTYESHHIPQVTTVANRKFDTMHALHFLRSYHASGGDEEDSKKSGLGLALKPHITSLFTNLPYYNRDIEDAVGRRFYCGLDNIATFLAGREQWRQLREWQLEDVFFNDGMRIPYILEEWKTIGANVDLRRALLFRKFLTERISKGELLISKITPPLFNPGSPQQVAALLYQTWGLPEQYNIKRVGRLTQKVLTTDNEARKRLRAWIAKQPAEAQAKFQRARIFLDLQDYVEGESTKLTFLDRIDADGRIHPRYKPTSTFRIATSPNIQNWPIYDLAQWGGARRDVKSEGASVPTGEDIVAMGSLRSIIIPDEPEDLTNPYDGHVLVTIDFEQIEIWMYAKQTNCKWLLDIYDRGEYIYGTFYEVFYDLPFFQAGMPRKKKFKLPEVSEKFLRRTKAIPLGWLYKRSNAAIAEEHQIPVKDVEAYHKRWFSQVPEITAQYSADEYLMHQKGYIRYPFGHVIHYPNRKASESAANRGQNPAAGMLRSSIIKLYDELKRREYARDGVRMLFTVHDSITFNIPVPLVEEVKTEVISPILGRQVPELGG